MAIDGALLKLPLMGILLTKDRRGAIYSDLGTLISSGVPILEGLEITARTARETRSSKSRSWKFAKAWRRAATLPIR